MKSKLMKMVALCSVAFATVAMADVAQPAPATPVTAVAAAAQNVTLLNGKVNPNAQVYFYLQSASWCVPCRMAMPGVIDAYKEMLQDGRAEVILVNYDRTPEEGKAYIQSYKTSMPTVHAKDPNLAKLPGFTRARGIPFVIVVDASGNVLAQGAPTRIQQWKTLVK